MDYFFLFYICFNIGFKYENDVMLNEFFVVERKDIDDVCKSKGKCRIRGSKEKFLF